MREIKYVLLILILTGLVVGGCSNQGGTAADDLPANPTFTEVSIEKGVQPTAANTVMSAPVLPTSTYAPTVVATSSPTEQEKPFDPASLLDCGEVFCLAEWPGFLNRPFAVEDLWMIDPTYPYAHTKGGTLEAHRGVEFLNRFGTPVLAAADGEVVYVGDDELTVLGPYTHFYGNVVMLRHPGLFFGEDLFTVYAHLSVIDAAEGALVSAGEKLGEVGATGAADGPHLHFEVRLATNSYDHTYNPILWFAPIHPDQNNEAGSALAGSITDRYGDPVPEYDFVLEALDPEGGVIKRYYPKTYVIAKLNTYPNLEENFVVPDLPPGAYRLTYIAGALHEIYFTLEPGALGWVSIQFD